MDDSSMKEDRAGIVIVFMACALSGAIVGGILTFCAMVLLTR